MSLYDNKVTQHYYDSRYKAGFKLQKWLLLYRLFQAMRPLVLLQSVVQLLRYESANGKYLFLLIPNISNK